MMQLKVNLEEGNRAVSRTLLHLLFQKTVSNPKKMTSIIYATRSMRAIGLRSAKQMSDNAMSLICRNRFEHLKSPL